MKLLVFFISSFIVLTSSLSFAAPKFPPLTGRVVDEAHILSPQSNASLTNLLLEHERKTTDQVVIATVPSLEGNEISAYSISLFRHWQLGQKDKNNGVLLLIAPNERAAWITTGYGMEGVLTDTICSQIVHNIMIPKFKIGDMQQGISDGAVAIISVLEGKQVELGQATPQEQAPENSIPPWFIIIGIILIIFIRWRFGIWLIPFGIGSGRSSGGGGFSGGGGSSGGGGAGGKW